MLLVVCEMCLGSASRLSSSHIEFLCTKTSHNSLPPKYGFTVALHRYTLFLNTLILLLEHLPRVPSTWSLITLHRLRNPKLYFKNINFCLRLAICMIISFNMMMMNIEFIFYNQIQLYSNRQLCQPS
jgi:hypothetical protein